MLQNEMLEKQAVHQSIEDEITRLSGQILGLEEELQNRESVLELTQAELRRMSAKVQELTQDLQQRVLAHQLALSLSLSLLYINIYNVVNYQQNKTTRQPEGRPIVPEGVWKFSLRGCFEYVYNIAVYKLCIIPMSVGEMKDFLGSLA